MDGTVRCRRRCRRLLRAGKPLLFRYRPTQWRRYALWDRRRRAACLFRKPSEQEKLKNQLGKQENRTQFSFASSPLFVIHAAGGLREIRDASTALGMTGYRCRM